MEKTHHSEGITIYTELLSILNWIYNPHSEHVSLPESEFENY